MHQKILLSCLFFSLMACTENSSELSESVSSTASAPAPEALNFPEFIAGHYNHEEKYWESSDKRYKTTMSVLGFSGLCRSDEDGGCRSGLGLVNNEGKIILKPIYDSYNFLLFHKGLFLVGLNGKEGLINKQGKEIVAPQYDHFREEKLDDEMLAVRSVDGLWGYINLTGEIIIPIQYGNVEVVGDSMIAVMNEPQKWGYINYQNKLIIPMQFWSTSPFEKGKATRLQKDDGEFTVYTDGRIEQTKKW